MADLDLRKGDAQPMKPIIKRLREHAPVVLSGTAIIGVVSTGYLAAKGAVKAQKKLDMLTVDADFKTQVKEVWVDYIPATISGATTIACIVGNTKVTGKRAAAAQAAFVLTERAYSEYRDNVIETHGKAADVAIRDKMAEDHIRNNEPSEGQMSVIGNGEVLCCELYSGRYFSSSMQTLRKAQNDLNASLLKHDRCSLNDFYDFVGLPGTTHSHELGWKSERQMELQFTSVMGPNDTPCLGFEYNYVMPIYGGSFE